MIVAKLSGRLGNQMFQYAAARSLAARLGTEVKLDTSWLEYKGAKGPARRYELGRFGLDVRVGHVRDFARLPAEKPALQALQRIRPRRRPFLRVIREDPYGEFVPEVLNAEDDVYLDGYWQCEDYFAAHEQLIRSDFSFPGPLSEAGAALAGKIELGTSVSMHVRRGDYVRSRFIYSLDADHYRRAFELIAGNTGDLQVFVFSDDPGWCKENLCLDRPTVVVGREDIVDPFENVHLMSRCEHHVIANSTFSWWGAWLNPRPGKIVVAPTRWFRDPEIANGEPRTPRSWIRL
jgi:hypothetical protein